MFDPLLTLIAAKTKAVGLIAGTAMVTTALVGGGAVAMTTVSDETPLAAETAVVLDPAVTTAPTDLEVVESVASATPTVGIEKPKKPRPPLPADFTCDDTKNHGQNVSAYAKSLPKGPGRGAKVSAVAQSDCGKKAKDASEADETEADEVEADEVEEPKAAKAAKPGKAAKAAKPAKRAKAAKAAKDRGAKDRGPKKK